MNKNSDSNPTAKGVGDDIQKVFVRYQVRHQSRIFAFILTLVPDWNDAEEILQETSIVLWNKFSDFEIGTDFGKWARAVARFEIRKYYEKKRREKRVFSEEVVAALYENFESDPYGFDERSAALRTCIKNLEGNDHKLIVLRYFSQSTTGVIAEQFGRSVESVCNSLRRIRDQLLSCVLQELRK